MLQIVGVGAIQLSQAVFILNPGTVVPVTVDLYRPEKAGMGKFVGGGVAGAAKGVGKAGLSGSALLNTIHAGSKPSKHSTVLTFRTIVAAAASHKR